MSERYSCDECGRPLVVVEFGALAHEDGSTGGHVARNQAREDARNELYADVKQAAYERKLREET